jgi:hypothetical protein
MKLVTLIKMCLTETYMCNHLSYALLVQSGPNQADALLPLFFNSALEYAIWNIQENKEVLELNGTYWLLVYADNINLLGKNINAFKNLYKLC